MGSYARFQPHLTTLEVETCPKFLPPSPVSGPLWEGGEERKHRPRVRLHDAHHGQFTSWAGPCGALSQAIGTTSGNFGGDFGTEAIYRDEAVQCLIVTGGRQECWDDPEAIMSEARATGMVAGEAVEAGWMIWPPIPFHYRTINDVGTAPSPPDAAHWLGTDDTARSVAARVIYGFRISVLFGFTLTAVSSVIGVLAGAVQGFYGGLTDLLFQRFIEIWSGMPQLLLLIILASIITPSFWVLLLFLLAFSWMALTGVVRAEFLRGRNLDYVRAAQALGVSDWGIMRRHILPNALVATLTFLPFTLSGSVTVLATLDFLGFGLPPGSPSLGELVAQGKNNLQAPWLGFSAFLVLGGLLTLLIFIGEAVRDAFDPRQQF